MQIKSKKLKIVLILFILSIIAWVGYYFYPRSVPKTAIISTPVVSAHKVNEIFPIPITVDRLKTPINAVQIDLSYDPSHLELMDFTTTGSFAKIFIEKTIDNHKGYARLSGGLPNPGFVLTTGHFAMLYFRTKAGGDTQINYLPTSLILANDGHSTNVIDNLPTVPISISSDVLSQASQKAQQASLESTLTQSADPDQTLLFDK